MNKINYMDNYGSLGMVLRDKNKLVGFWYESNTIRDIY